MSKTYVEFENKSKTGKLLVEVVVTERVVPAGKNIVMVKPVAGEGEMQIWAKRVITK